MTCTVLETGDRQDQRRPCQSEVCHGVCGWRIETCDDRLVHRPDHFLRSRDRNSQTRCPGSCHGLCDIHQLVIKTHLLPYSETDRTKMTEKLLEPHCQLMV